MTCWVTNRSFIPATAEAVQELQQARERQERLLAAEPSRSEYRVELASTRLAQGSLALYQKKQRAATEHLRACLALLQPHPGGAYQPEMIDLQAAAHLHLGTGCNEQGRNADAETELKQAVELAQRLVKDYPVVMRYRVRLASGLAAQANLDKYRNRAGALEKLNQAARLLETVEAT